MAVSMLDNISYLGKKPDNVRSQFATIADMKAISENYLPDIYEAFCLEDGNKYRYNRSNSEDETTGKWRLVSDGGSADLTSYYNITQIDAKEKTLRTDIDTNTENVATNTKDISDLKTKVSDNETNITDLTTRVTTNEKNISINTSNIKTNVDDISTLKDKVSTAETNISTLTTKVATNETNITTNTTKLSEHDTKISNLESSVATNTSDIVTNKTNISTNATNIAANKTAIEKNATDITNLTTRVATNETNISTNTSNIKTNTDDIAELKTKSDANTADITDLKTRVSTNEKNIGDVSTFALSSWTDLVAAVNYNYNNGLKSIAYKIADGKRYLTFTNNDTTETDYDITSLITDTKINELNDVNIADIADAQTLSYDSATSTWKNSTVDLQGTLESAKKYTDEQIVNAQKNQAYSVDVDTKPVYNTDSLSVTYIKNGETLTFDDSNTNNTPWFYYYENSKPVQTKWVQQVEYTIDMGSIDFSDYVNYQDVVSTYTGLDSEDKTKVPNIAALDALNALITTTLANKVNTADIIDDLTSTETAKPLSANQGRVLNEGLNTKVNTSDIVDTLDSDATDKPLSASQGKNLKTEIDTKVNITDIVDNLTSEDTDKPLSANQGKILSDKIDTAAGARLSPDDVIDNLTSTETAKPLSANQGRVLNETLAIKVNTSDIVDDLITASTDKPLSANQGKVLKTEIDTKVNTSDIVNNLTSEDTDKPLSANQGKVLSDTLTTNLATKVNITDIVDDLASTDTDKPLSANQGKVLNEKIDTELAKKVNITDIVDNLTSLDTDKPLSANQGKVLSEKIDTDLTAKLDIQQSTDEAGKVAIIGEDGKITFTEAKGLSGDTAAENVSYENTNYTDYKNVKLAIDGILSRLDYVKPSITSFTSTPSGGTFEVGSKVSEVTFNWTVNKDIVTQTLTDCILADATVRIATYSNEISSNKTFTLNVSDGTNSATKSISFSFLNKVYYGSAALKDTYDSAFILGLSGSKFASNYKGTYSITVNAGEYGFICFPSTFGILKSAYIGGFETELTSVGDVSFTNASGGVATYSIYRTGQANLGTISMEVK